GEIAKGATRRRFDDDGGDGRRVETKRLLEGRLQMLTNTSVNRKNHSARHCTPRHSSGELMLAVSLSGSPKSARASGPRTLRARRCPSACARRSPAARV